MTLLKQIAIRQADFDGRNFDAMSRGERERYINRARHAVLDVADWMRRQKNVSCDELASAMTSIAMEAEE